MTEPERFLLCECCGRAGAELALVPERSPVQLCTICRWVCVGSGTDAGEGVNHG